MELLDSRRLPGPSLLLDRAGVVLDVRCSGETANSLATIWKSYVRKMLDGIGWENEVIANRTLSSGISMAFSAPIDLLYSAMIINDWAWTCCEAVLGDTPMPDFNKSLLEINAAIADEANPELIALSQAANANRVPLLWDDDEVTLGLGGGSITWPSGVLPDVESVDWSRFKKIPIGLVTGTNGKTTTARLVQHILRRAGKAVGISSTDWIAVNDNIIDKGDWSGPGGARQVLRQQDVEIAVLETARGGLLRRGLGVTEANVALITNVSEDHLGDFGSETVAELLNIKWVVSRAVMAQGTLILNADDDLLVKKSRGYSGRIVWFSLSADNWVVAEHVKQGGVAYIFDARKLFRLENQSHEIISAVGQIPITMDGIAKHNIANALAAAAMCEQFGVSISDIRAGLISMSQAQNPGRSNIYDLNGTTILVDFAHNPAAMESIFEVARSLPANRRLLSFGQAGDRPDELIRTLAQYAWAIGLDAVIVSELAEYHRGRSYGEVYEIIKNELLTCGALKKQIKHFDEEMDSLQAALDWAEPGDLIIMLALGDKASIQDKLESLQTVDQESRAT